MSYTIIDRPSGTTAFEPGILEQIAPLLKAGAKGIGDSMYRKAAAKAGLQPSYKQDAEGNWTTSYEKPANTELEAINKMFGIKKSMKESAIDDEAPRLANATSYLRKAIEAGGDPEKLTEMVKPERFKFSEQQKEINSAMTTGMSLKKSEASLSKKAKDIFTPANVQKVLGTLEAGQTIRGLTGDTVPFEDRQSAENYLLSNLGPDWQNIAPDALGILDKKWPDKTKETIAPAKSTEKPVIQKKTASVVADKSVVNRVGVLRKTGWTDGRIAEALRQKNIDPLLYGIKGK